MRRAEAGISSLLDSLTAAAVVAESAAARASSFWLRQINGWSPGGRGADPTRNQLSGAVGGRASSALISIVKASLRAVFRGGSFVDGCGIAAQSVPWRCLRLFAAGGLLLAAWRKTRLATHQGRMLWRDVRRMRPGGEGACVTTLLEMPFGYVGLSRDTSLSHLARDLFG